METVKARIVVMANRGMKTPGLVDLAFNDAVSLLNDVHDNRPLVRMGLANEQNPVLP